MICARADDVDAVVDVCEFEQAFTFYIRVCDILSVKGWGIVVKDAEKVVVRAEGLV